VIKVNTLSVPGLNPKAGFGDKLKAHPMRWDLQAGREWWGNAVQND
jgi:hypothetical protein